MRWCWLVLLCCACGPVVVPGGGDDDGATATSGDVGSSTSDGGPVSSTAPTTADPTEPGSTTSTPGTSDTGSHGSEDSGDSSSSGIGFIDPTQGGCEDLPDGVLGHCTFIDCTPEEQDCFEGEACKAWANDGTTIWNATRCAPVADEPGQLGEPCIVEGSAVTGVDTCDVGLMCWNVDAKTNEGACVQFCDPIDGDPGCADPGATCNVSNEGVLPLCLPACDPLEPSCGEGFGCYPGSDSNFVCLREGEQVEYDWVFHPECPAGTFMANSKQIDGCTDEEPCCASFCDLSAEQPCGPKVECLPYFKLDTPPFEDVGYCGALP